jgi:hypothetical protein
VIGGRCLHIDETAYTKQQLCWIIVLGKFVCHLAVGNQDLNRDNKLEEEKWD